MPLVEEPEAFHVLAHVAIRKDAPDENASRREQLFFRLVFRPFLRFAFKYFHIPSPHRLKADGSVEFLEGVAIATTAERAKELCLDDHYRIAWLPVDDPLPRASVQFRGHVYPRARKPLRYCRPVFPFTAIRRDVLNRQLDNVLTEINSLTAILTGKCAKR